MPVAVKWTDERELFYLAHDLHQLMKHHPILEPPDVDARRRKRLQAEAEGRLRLVEPPDHGPPTIIKRQRKPS